MIELIDKVTEQITSIHEKLSWPGRPKRRSSSVMLKRRMEMMPDRHLQWALKEEGHGDDA